MIMVEVFS